MNVFPSEEDVLLQLKEVNLRQNFVNNNYAKIKLRVKELNLVCPRKSCGYKWNYKGKASFYTSCPRCKSNVRVVQ